MGRVGEETGEVKGEGEGSSRGGRGRGRPEVSHGARARARPLPGPRACAGILPGPIDPGACAVCLCVALRENCRIQKLGFAKASWGVCRVL